MTTDSTTAVLVPHGELAELLTEVHPCGCLSTPDYGYLPCPACRLAADAPVWGETIDAEFFEVPELLLDAEGEVIPDDGEDDSFSEIRCEVCGAVAETELYIGGDKVDICAACAKGSK